MRIQLFATCLVDSLFPEVGEAVVEVLTRAGVETWFPPGQTCCGQPALNAGSRAEARRLALHTLEALAAEDVVVVPSGSCSQMIRHHYPELLADQPEELERARRLADRTFEFSEFLVDQLLVADLEASLPLVIGYHPSCHLLRGLGVDRQPLRLLEGIDGASIERLSPECCGFGGLFSVEMPEISREMLERTLERIRNSGVELVAGCDVSCLMQIEGGLRRTGSPVRCSHLAQLLAGREAGLK
ncbi:MAG TPA: (Fe-S)-binding protein [Anaerolineales bacterium]